MIDPKDIVIIQAYDDLIRSLSRSSVHIINEDMTIIYGEGQVLFDIVGASLLVGTNLKTTKIANYPHVIEEIDNAFNINDTITTDIILDHGQRLRLKMVPVTGKFKTKYVIILTQDITEHQNIIYKERERFARIFHERIKPSVFSAKLLGDACRYYYLHNNLDASTRAFEDMRAAVDDTLYSLEEVMRDLQEVDYDASSNKNDVLTSIDHQSESTPIDIKIDTDGNLFDLPIRVQDTFFRIAQEAYHNMVRHSGASQALIKAKFRRRKGCISISDNGKGFDLEKVDKKYQLGIAIMQERMKEIGGEFVLRSAIGQGTEVIISWHMKE